MKTNVRILGALFAAVVGGCAGTKSTAVPLQPLAQGQPVDASSYDLTVDGQPGGRVLMTRGQALRNAQGQNLIIVGMQIDNKTGDRTYRLPTDQIYLSNLGGQAVKLVQIDGQPVPGSIDVPPGDTRDCDLTFMPVAPYAKRDLNNVQVHWSLLIDGASAPIVRTTPFSRLNRDFAERNQYTAQLNSGYPRYDLPSKPYLKGNDMSEDFRAQQSGGGSWNDLGGNHLQGNARHHMQEGPER